MILLTECGTARERQQFEDVAEDLNGHYAAFVPPFPGSVAKYLSEKSAFCRIHGDIFPFIAWREGRAVGRIAAIVNRSHNTYYKDTVGFFGFFECEDNEETARVLFDRVSALLMEKGCTAVRGPYNPSINDECGLLVENFEKPPYIGMTWNPPCYERLVLANGYQVAVTTIGMALPMHRLEVPERLKKITKRISERSKMTLRCIDLKVLDRELEIIHEVYNEALSKNWGFVPISMEDLLYAADDMRAIADRNVILIAEKAGERAGVALTLPNINEILIQLKKTPKWLRPLHFLWLLKTQRRTMVRQLVYGISPRFRDQGLHGWLLQMQFAEAKARYPNAELGWIQADNVEIIKAAEIVGAYKDVTWRIYEKALA